MREGINKLVGRNNGSVNKSTPVLLLVDREILHLEGVLEAGAASALDREAHVQLVVARLGLELLYPLRERKKKKTFSHA